MNISLSAFASENLVSRDGSTVPSRGQPAHLHTQAESNAYLRDSSQVPRVSGHAIACRWRSLPRVRRLVNLKVVPNECCLGRFTMDQLKYASLSHTHYWYEVGMLKVPAVIVLDRHNLYEYCNRVVHDPGMVANPARGQLIIMQGNGK